MQTITPITTCIVSYYSLGQGGDTNTALNTWIFIAVWYQVIEDKRYALHDWTVKASLAAATGSLQNRLHAT